MKDWIKQDEFFMNWNNWVSVLIKNLNKLNTDKLTKDKSFIQSLENISNFRWNILSISTSIENLINLNIEFILFNVKDDSSELFQNLFLRTSNLTFFAKWNIFKEICKKSHKTKNNYNKEIISSIQKSIEIRNNIAHWYLYYDYKTKSFYIEYYKNNKIIKDLINDEYIKENTKELYNCINNINILIYWEDTTIKKQINK